nr:MAG TPA: hypothetical protein [Caudoviricetes sp.]
MFFQFSGLFTAAVTEAHPPRLETGNTSRISYTDYFYFSLFARREPLFAFEFDES